MRIRSMAVVLGVCLGTIVSAVPASADIYLSGAPDAPETTCGGTYENDEVVCTFPAIGGKVFAAGGFGSGAFTITLEADTGVPGAPPRVLARCYGVGSEGCIAGSGHAQAPVPAGTMLTCRAFGVSRGTFECSSFEID